MTPPVGVLVLAATPIGRSDDASPRLAAELAAADVVAAEDTRRLRRLTSELGIEITGRVVSYFEGNEHTRTASLVEALVGGQRVVLVTDAGMPSVSDPGYRLVAAAIEHDVLVTSVPGPSAVLSALAVSGLPVDRFCFEGFLPRKAGERARRLSDLAEEQRTLVFFEAPHRTHAALVALAEALGGERRGAVCRELTKTHEEVRRGPLADLVAWAADGVRGEVTIVVEGAGEPEAVTDPAALAGLVAREEAAGAGRKEAIAAVARRAGVPKRAVYDAAHGIGAAADPEPPMSAPTRSRHGGDRDRTRPALPEPLPHPVVDNHCHLDIADGPDGAWLATDEALALAASVGVTRIVQIGCDLPGAHWAVETARTHPQVVAGVALHPNEAPLLAERGVLDDALAEIEQLARSSERVRAIGETGLDYFRTDEVGRPAQHASFRAHVELARTLDKTLVIHDRDAHDDVLRVIDEVGAPDRWVMHCFSGNERFARACLDRGAYLSFAGTVTFKNADDVRAALRVAPADRILVETDAPYLTPSPHRGRPNASYLVPLTVRAMAQTREQDVEELCRAIWANTAAAFGGPWGGGSDEPDGDLHH